MPRRDSGMPCDTRNTTDTSGNVLERQPARGGPSSALFDNSKNVASSSCGLRPGTTGNIMHGTWWMRGETRAEEFVNANSTFQSRYWNFEPFCIILMELVLRMVWWITQEFRIRNCILENSRTQRNFKDGKSTSKTEVCSKSADPHLTMHWIKEVEIAKSIEELMTSRSIVGRIDFPTSTCLMR